MFPARTYYAHGSPMDGTHIADLQQQQQQHHIRHYYYHRLATGRVEFDAVVSCTQAD